MGKNARPPRRRTPLWTRWCIALGVLLMLGSGGIMVAERVLVTSATGAVRQQELLGSARRLGDRHPDDLGGAMNILLVGLDTRPGWAHTGLLSRSDSIILVHVPADHSSAYLVSLPRDSYVAIPAYDNGKARFPGGHDKINAAFAYGSRGLTGTAAQSHGFELLTMTIEELTGITPDAGAIIDFSGFTQVLRILGQVCLHVDETVTSIHVGHDANGDQARPYTTDSGGSIRGRSRASPRTCTAPATTVSPRPRRWTTHASATCSATATATTAGRTMTVDDGGVSLADWAFAMRSIDPADVVALKTNDGKYHSATIPGLGSVEILSATSRQMLRAARSDTLAAFVRAHPSWQAPS